MNIFVIVVAGNSRLTSRCTIFQSKHAQNARQQSVGLYREEAVLSLRTPVPDYLFSLVAGRLKLVAAAKHPVKRQGVKKGKKRRHNCFINKQ